MLFSQWEQDVRLTNDVNNSSLPLSLRTIFAKGDTIHVVWEDDRKGNYEIYYKRSLNNGTTWGNDTRLTSDPNISIQPSISGSGSYVHIVWLDTRDGNWEIYYKNSPDGGNTWGNDIKLTDNPYDSYAPVVFARGSYVHVIWVDRRDGNDEIYYKRSKDNGITWEPDKRLTNNPFTSTNPSLWVSDTTLYIVWQENRDGNWEIYFKKSTDNGTTWGPDIRLTINPNNSLYPSISASYQNIHVVWVDNRDGNSEIYYKRSNDGGNSWGSDTRLTNNPQESFYPSVFAWGLNVHLVWTDERDGNREIYYKRSINGGTTWEPDLRLTDNVNVSQRPSIFVSGSNVHIVWMDDRDGNWEIYYKRNKTGNDIEEGYVKKEREFKNSKFCIYDLAGRNLNIYKPSGVYYIKKEKRILKVIKLK